MPAKDGLLVRLRVTASRLSATTLRALAEAGRICGNGLFDLTSRGNLQMRGVSEERLPLLLQALGSLGLLDETVSGEAVRNVLVSPLAGPDIVAVAAELERALVADPSLHALPGKFGFLIDDGSRPSLAAIPADIRFVQGTSAAFAIGLGGCETDAAFVGACTAQEIVPAALRLARAFLHFSASLTATPGRMRDLRRAVAPDVIAAAAGFPPATRRKALQPATGEPRPIGLLPLGTNSSCFGIGAAFGRLEAMMLDKAAAAAERFGTGEIRLTPWRILLLPGVASAQEEAATAFCAEGGYITDPLDPRLGVAACVGLSGCDSATTDTQADASALAGLARRLAPAGIALHVSGCAKGCARAQRTPIVLIARESRYDMVLDGTAGGTPLARGLTMIEASAKLEEIARARRMIS
jgi:precorrin-3B synthase